MPRFCSITNLNKTKALQWRKKALTVKGQSLFSVFSKSAHPQFENKLKHM